MAVSGRLKRVLFIAVAFLASGCLEQELDPYTVAQAHRLIGGSSSINPKVWTGSTATHTLRFYRSTTTNVFLIRSTATDTLAFGTWRLSQTNRNIFTDTLFFDVQKGTNQALLQDAYSVRTLTSRLLLLQSPEGNLEWSSVEE